MHYITYLHPHTHLNPRLLARCISCVILLLITSSDVTLKPDLDACCVFSHHHCLKVDMFSYGMVLYELLSGQRPALGHHQLQIAKKLSKGIRPVLGSPEEVQFYCLHSLLTECWDTKPEKVRLPAC